MPQNCTNLLRWFSSCRQHKARAFVRVFLSSSRIKSPSQPKNKWSDFCPVTCGPHGPTEVYKISMIPVVCPETEFDRFVTNRSGGAAQQNSVLRLISSLPWASHGSCHSSAASRWGCAQLAQELAEQSGRWLRGTCSSAQWRLWTDLAGIVNGWEMLWWWQSWPS